MAGRENINGFVLAGGKSSRMGKDKGLMQIDGKLLVVRTAEVLRPFVREVKLLGPPDRYADLGLPVMADLWADQGPLAAVCTGLLSSPAEWNIFLACDLPRVSETFIQLLLDRVLTTRADAVVPRTEDGWQPLAAAYHSRCRTPFAQAFYDGRRSLIKLLEEVPVEAITRGEMVGAGLSEEELANMNTPQDWARLARTSKGAR